MYDDHRVAIFDIRRSHTLLLFLRLLLIILQGRKYIDIDSDPKSATVSTDNNKQDQKLAT